MQPTMGISGHNLLDDLNIGLAGESSCISLQNDEQSLGDRVLLPRPTKSLTIKRIKSVAMFLHI